MVTEGTQPAVVDTADTDPETNTSPVDTVEVDPAIVQEPVAVPQEEPEQPVRKLTCSHGTVRGLTAAWHVRASCPPVGWKVALLLG